VIVEADRAPPGQSQFGKRLKERKRELGKVEARKEKNVERKRLTRFMSFCAFVPVCPLSRAAMVHGQRAISVIVPAAAK